MKPGVAFDLADGALDPGGLFPGERHDLVQADPAGDDHPDAPVGKDGDAQPASHSPLDVEGNFPAGRLQDQDLGSGFHPRNFLFFSQRSRRRTLSRPKAEPDDSGFRPNPSNRSTCFPAFRVWLPR